jgi:hypothetical protein
MEFTAASGDPVMCMIIFTAKVFKDEWRTGVDPFVEWIAEPNYLLKTVVIERVYPFGPSCFFKGKHIPCFCCHSESGSITGHLLTEMLKCIDSLQVFDRENSGLNPFLILDGHGSRFDLEFLKYINAHPTKWNVNIGLPYGTSCWQVGDSSEQNGCSKMALTKAKQELVTKKNDRVRIANLTYNISVNDIINTRKSHFKINFKLQGRESH